MTTTSNGKSTRSGFLSRKGEEFSGIGDLPAESKKLSMLSFAVIAAGMVLIYTTATDRPGDGGGPVLPETSSKSAPKVLADTDIGRQTQAAHDSIATVIEPAATPYTDDPAPAPAGNAGREQPENWVTILYPELARIEELENQPGDIALASLLPMLSDADPVVRLAALVSLSELGRQAPLGALTAALEDSESQIRIAALEALAMRRDREAAPSVEAMVFDSDAQVRRAAIDTLAAIGDRSSVHALAAALGDPDPAARRGAVGALGEIGGSAALGYLRQVRYDPDESIRASANAILREEALRAD